MPMRSQVDHRLIYEMYKDKQDRKDALKQQKISNIMNVVQAVPEIAGQALKIGDYIGGKVKERKMNNVMKDINYSTPDAYNASVGNSINKVNQFNPQAANTMYQGWNTYNQGIQKTASEIDKEKSIVRQNDAQVAKYNKEAEKSEIERQQAEYGYKGKQAEVIYNNLKDVTNQAQLDGAYTRLTAQGIPLTDAYKDYNVFAQNRDKLFDSTKAQRDEANRLVEEADKKLKSKKSEADLQGTYLDNKGKTIENSGREIDNKQKQWNLDNPKKEDGKPLPVTSAEAIGNAGFMLDNLQVLYTKLADNKLSLVSGNSFIDPDFKIALDAATNSKARKESGAAINETEWKNFYNLIMDKKNLLTEKGRIAALNNLKNIIGQYYVYGSGVSGSRTDDTSWYNNYKVTKSRGIDELSGSYTDDDIISQYRK